MPQLIPFHFLGQIIFSFLTLVVLIYVFSKYILPNNTYLKTVRQYIDRLSSDA
jgi:F-type H+-transporting ATPase subunit 8